MDSERQNSSVGDFRGGVLFVSGNLRNRLFQLCRKFFRRQEQQFPGVRFDLLKRSFRSNCGADQVETGEIIADDFTREHDAFDMAAFTALLHL